MNLRKPEVKLCIKNLIKEKISYDAITKHLFLLLTSICEVYHGRICMNVLTIDTITYMRFTS